VTRVILAGASGRTGTPVRRRNRRGRGPSEPRRGASRRAWPERGPELLSARSPRRSARFPRERARRPSPRPGAGRGAHAGRASRAGLAVVPGERRASTLDARERGGRGPPRHGPSCRRSTRPQLRPRAVLAMQFAEQARGALPARRESWSCTRSTRVDAPSGTAEGHRRAGIRARHGERTSRSTRLAAARPRRPPGDAARRRGPACSRSGTTRPSARGVPPRACCWPCGRRAAELPRRA